MNKKISVITITLNSERYIEQTIASVINQSYSNIEYVIIDGGSTDNTLDIIKKYEFKINRWISEPDEGIANAMNKGLAMATGDYILFLHSDDYLLHSLVMEEASGCLNNNFDIFFFQVISDNKGTKKITRNRGLGWWTNFKMNSCHQGQLCSGELYKKLGFFDTNYKIDMDYDFILRAYRAGITSLAVDHPISVMRTIGISSKTDWPNLRQRLREEQRIHMNYCTSNGMRLLYKFYWSFYLPYKKIRSFLKQPN